MPMGPQCESMDGKGKMMGPMVGWMGWADGKASKVAHSRLAVSLHS